MDIFRSSMGRRRFLSVGSIALVSPWIIKAFGAFSRATPAIAAEQPGVFNIRNDEWLNLTIEKAIEPDLPICDPHHHLWSTATDSYLMEEFLSDISGGHNIVKTVFVEAYGLNQQRGTKKMEPLEYTEFVVAETSRVKSLTDVAAGIVGYADLMVGNTVASLLESHVSAGKGRFRGIRLAPGSVIPDTKFREGYATLSKYHLAVDVMGMDSTGLVSLGQAFPDTPIIVNHIGNPAGIGANDENSGKVMQEWRSAIKTIASCPNIYMKLGGLGMNSFKFGWNSRSAPVGSDELAKLTSPYFNYCIEQFGADRCMFESNFPVDRAAYSYTVLWNAFKKLTKGFSVSERRALFYDTAVKAYGLKA